MKHFLITQVSVDPDGWLKQALWREVDGSPGKFLYIGAPEIAQAMDRGDMVDLRATSPTGWLLANQLLERIGKGNRSVFRILSPGTGAQFRIDQF